MSQKQFTIEDLIPGGSTYKEMTPPDKKYFWNGYELIEMTSRNKDNSYLQNSDKASNGYVAYTENHNLYIKTDKGQTLTVSTDGNSDNIYGESVHRNEFGITKGTFWSPTGQYLAFYRMDQSMVESYPQINYGSEMAEMIPDRYPMAGTTSHKVYIGIYSIETGNTIWLETGDPSNRYFTNIAWGPDEKSLYIIELNREQNHAELYRYDTSNGKKCEMLIEEKDDHYVEPMNPIRFLPWDNNKFIFQSRKDGFNHIYLASLTEKEGKKEVKKITQLTEGSFEVIEVLGFYTDQKKVIYSSNEFSPISKDIYSVSMSGHRSLISKEGGWHNGNLSDSGRFLLDTYSSPSVCKNIDKIDIKKGTSQTVFSAEDPWKGYEVPEIKVGTIKAADRTTPLYYRLVLPTNFDPNKKYPTIVYVYGGPHEHLIDESHNYNVRGWDIWMAQNGYIVFTLDNRGSEHRGRDFEQVTFHYLGEEEMKDQMCGVRFLKSLPYVDSNRLGVHGWSFGGYMTTSLMTTYPDVFKVGVAGGPVIDWKYYEVMYGERYMGTPENNYDGYKSTSLLNKAGKLKGKLMLIYGSNDDTCVPQHTLSFVRACIDADVYPDLFVYPGQKHNMKGKDRIHLHNKITKYFMDNL